MLVCCSALLPPSLPPSPPLPSPVLGWLASLVWVSGVGRGGGSAVFLGLVRPGWLTFACLGYVRGAGRRGRGVVGSLFSLGWPVLAGWLCLFGLVGRAVGGGLR